MEIVQEKEKGIFVILKVIPASSKNELIKKEGVLRLKITAPPVDGKANKFVIEYLSKLFKVPKTSIEIVRGDSSREKTILFKVDDSSKRKQISDFINNL